MNNNLYLIMLRCLVGTIIIELLVAYIIKVRDKKDILNILLVNIMTNPLVVTIPLYFNIKINLLYRNISLYILELVTVIIEGFIYKKVLKDKRINPYILSIILNLSSYLIGEIINYLM